ncbi:F, portal protein [Endozoicomonas sp. (ex Bugula neritina AB1)]|nr:F, portal protein [Endozoicomonas sp. (ex Bugula neritina AB1)]
MANKPTLGEIAQADHGIMMSKAYTAMLLENPDSVLQQRGRDMKLYDELLRDDQVKPCFQQRRLSVTQAEWEVDPASESAEDKAAAEFIKEQLQNTRFDDITDKMLYGIFYGYGIAECLWAIDGNRIVLDDIKVRERSRFRFDHEGQLRLIKINQPNGMLLPERKFWVFTSGADHSDNPYGLGLAHYLYWPTFFKRNGIKFWLIFLEKFGMPTAAAKLPLGQAQDPIERGKALAALEAIQSDSGVVIPDNIVIDLIEAARSGTADYEALCNRMDASISKVILSQTMTTDNGSSRSQAEVHQDVQQAVIKSDADLICESFNQQVVTWLTEWNFPNATPPRVWRNTEPEEDLMQRADRDNKISTLGYEPTEEYITDTYGPGWKKKETSLLPMGNPTDPLPPEFSEVSGLTLKRAGHRADMQSLMDAAQFLSTKYQELYGDRVEQLMNYMDETGDIETFREKLTKMMEDQPKKEAVELVKHANFFTRMMGAFKNGK